MKQVKVWIPGILLIPGKRRSQLRQELEKRDVSIVGNLQDADVMLHIIGSDKTRELRGQVLAEGKPFVMMRPEHDDTILGCMLIGEAILPEDTARWVWSVVNEPEKWRAYGG